MSAVTAPAVEKQPIDWEKIRRALEAWVELVFPKPQICDLFWEDQEIPQPEYPYLTLKRTAGPTKEGATDELRQKTDLTQPLGQENELQTVGPRAFTLTIQAHAKKPVGFGQDALALLARLEASADQERSRDIFTPAGLSVIETLGPTDISAFENATWVSRANLDVRFRTLSVITERRGFIEQVKIRSDELGVPEFTIDAS
jgi:hypothetical protein